MSQMRQTRTSQQRRTRASWWHVVPKGVSVDSPLMAAPAVTEVGLDKPEEADLDELGTAAPKAASADSLPMAAPVAMEANLKKPEKVDKDETAAAAPEAVNTGLPLMATPAAPGESGEDERVQDKLGAD
jgi:hypothetical protein